METGTLQMDHAGGVEPGQIVTWVGGAFVGLAAAIRWIVQWLSGRNEKRLAALERESRDHAARTVIVGEALALLLAEHRLLVSGSSDAILRAERALKKVFPLMPDVPASLLDLAAKLDAKD